ncbi:MAG TPA: NAD(P)-dependent oxidoreductase [Chitinophagaceae bacterium]|nr:NAD(P)-dependent oxidoreductase [Chitinophagaceae bacterium]
MRIGLIRERKDPPDTRVPFTPKQCVEVMEKYPGIQIVVESSPNRCYTDEEYRREGVPVVSDMRDCEVLLGVKEVPEEELIEGKTYFFFSHTKKMQPYNRGLMQAMIRKHIRMIDYECLTHTDGQRILGFGFFAGVVGAHNGILTYGKKHGLYELPKANDINSYADLLSYYDQLLLPNIKIAVTGSGKVSSGILEIMSHLDIQSIEPDDYITNDYEYPVYTHLKGGSLYRHRQTGTYGREHFHQHPAEYESLFRKFLPHTDILMNGIYWDKQIPRLFEQEDITNTDFRISVIADITCDPYGSVPINIAASTIADPVYGIEKTTMQRTAPFLDTPEVIDIMAVDNLPNELPRDASKYFGAHFEKYVLEALLEGYDSDLIHRATICSNGKLNNRYSYLEAYAYGS